MPPTNSKTRSLLFVHGHHFKPEKTALQTIWHDALRWGIERDYPEKLVGFDAVLKDMAYFGDLSNRFLGERKAAYDESLDIADRRLSFAALKKLTKRKKFNRYDYQQLPGQTALKEALADISAPLLSLGLAQPAIGKLAPELVEYWNPDSAYSASVKNRVRTALTETISRSDEVMVIAHCMGAIVVYDVFRELSQSLQGQKVDVLMTIGCPLGNKAVQSRLSGHSQAGTEKYPSNIVVWDNVAAEDDYVCHDKTVADDFRAMIDLHMISSINDYRIYNMAVRYGKSNPHSSIGYLVHPRVSMLLAEWLQSA